MLLKSFFVSLFLTLYSPLLFAGSIKCFKPYTMVLDGTSQLLGVRQEEHMVLEKVVKRGGLNGRWKLTAWDIRCIGPYPSPPITYEEDYSVNTGLGMTLKFHMSIRGREILMKLIRSNYYLDVVNNRIGLKKTNLWIGKIRGNRVSLQFFQPQQLQKRGYTFSQQALPSTLLQGYVHLSSKRSGKIQIIYPARKQAVVFDKNKPAQAVIQASVRIEPAGLRGNIQWKFDNIAGSIVTIKPLSVTRANIYITNLPPSNDQFGKHTLRVLFNSPDGQCKGEDSVVIRLFYPAFAYNHPGSSDSTSLPNWFYYWRQTPAARPFGQKVRLVYGGRTACNCNKKNVVACYQTLSFNKLLYICDLSRPEFKGVFQITYPLLDRTQKPPLIGWKTTRYIDTFAVSIIHEFQHYLDEIAWVDRTTKRVPNDKDHDWIPDDREPSLRFDPAQKQTYRPTYKDKEKKVTLDVGGDEEWLAYEKMREYSPGTYKKFDWGCPGSQISPDKCR